MAQTQTLLVRPRIAQFVVEFMIALVGSAFLALLSQLAIPLPFTPIPLTLQTLGVFLLGGSLGKRRATYTVFAYLVQACIGLPVLAGAISNPLWFLAPKAGFLLSFVVAAFIIGYMTERQPKGSLLSLLLTLFTGQVVISLLGMLWLALYIGLSKAFLFGVVPFLSGALIKIIAAALCLKGISVLRNRPSTEKEITR